MQGPGQIATWLQTPQLWHKLRGIYHVSSNSKLVRLASDLNFSIFLHSGNFQLTRGELEWNENVFQFMQVQNSNKSQTLGGQIKCCITLSWEGNLRNCVSEGLDWSQVWGLAVTQVLSAWQIFATLAVLHSIACVCDSKHVRDVSVSRSGGASQRSVATPVIGKAEISGGSNPNISWEMSAWIWECPSS